MALNQSTELRPTENLDKARGLRDTFARRTPALEALLASLRGHQADPAPPRTQRSRQRAKAWTPVAEFKGRHDFMLQIVVAYCNGSTQQQIATELGVHVQTIRNALGDAGVKLGDRNTTFSDNELQTIRRLHADGTSARELGRRYGVAHTTILRQLR